MGANTPGVMTDPHKTLASKPSAAAPEAAELDGCTLLEQAIIHRLRVRWTYNRTEMQAAPQILYRRKNGVYLDAIVMERAGEAPAELKLGSFKLTGLTNLVIVNEAFTPARGINPADIRYKEGILARATR